MGPQQVLSGQGVPGINVAMKRYCTIPKSL